MNIFLGEKSPFCFSIQIDSDKALIFFCVCDICYHQIAGKHQAYQL